MSPLSLFNLLFKTPNFFAVTEDYIILITYRHALSHALKFKRLAEKERRLKVKNCLKQFVPAVYVIESNFCSHFERLGHGDKFVSNVGIWTQLYWIPILRIYIAVREVLAVRHWIMQSSLDRFLRKRQAPAESTCGEEEQCQEKEPKPTEATEDLSSRKHYEEKRKQEGKTFWQEWKKTFAWLQFDETKQEMFCTACREFSSLADKNSSFFTGSQAFHIGNIKAHASNRKHEACVLAQQQREQQERGSRNIVQSSISVAWYLLKLFNISYFIAKHERPFSDFEDFCKLHVKNGLSLGETYINDKGCRVFVEAIDGVMKED